MRDLSERHQTRPLIGVTVGNRTDRSGLPRLAVNTAYVTGLQAAGADVALLPPGPDGVASALLDRLDGLLLPGGVDVSPARYGEEPREGLGEVNEQLDELEIGLARVAAGRRLPLFGICRGQQVVNVALGGSLYQDLALDGLTDFPHATPLERGRDFLAHAIDVTPGSNLARALGAERREVNSFHHQAVRQIAPGLLVTAVSPDGVIEGMESADGLVLTVQCHPEELVAGHAWALGLFRFFAELAMERSPRSVTA